MPNVIFQTLDETVRGIPFGPNNDVTVPVGDPVIFRDGGLNVGPLTIEKTQAQSVAGTNPAAIRVIIESDIDAGIVIRNSDSTRLFALRNNGILFVPKDNTPAPGFYSIGVQTRDAGDTEAGGNLWINGGTAQDGPTGGDVFIFGGFGNGGANNGAVKIGPFNTSTIEMGSSSVPTEVFGDLIHTGTNLGFYGTTPAPQSAAYTPANVTTDRTYDADATTLAEIADVLGTLIADLQTVGLIG